MAETRPTPKRSSCEIADEVSTERDSDKVAELSEELIQALDKETNERVAQMATSDKEKSRRQSA